VLIAPTLLWRRPRRVAVQVFGALHLSTHLYRLSRHEGRGGALPATWAPFPSDRLRSFMSPYVCIPRFFHANSLILCRLIPHYVTVVANKTSFHKQKEKDLTTHLSAHRFTRPLTDTANNRSLRPPPVQSTARDHPTNKPTD
jgi:hypothetical protein